MAQDLSGKHVVVVGGSSGIGLALAAQAGAAGARLTLMGRDPAKLDAAASRTGAAARSVDLRRADTVQAACDGLGPVDHLVVTAGVFRTAKLADSTPADWRDVLEERLVGPLAMVKALAPQLTTSVTLCSGTLSPRPAEDSTVLSATLAAVENAGRALARELAPVRVNVVVPGAIDTPMLQGLLGAQKEAAVAAMSARLPAGRIGAPEDVAQAILMLMTNPFTTGAVLRIDGGGTLI